MITTSRLAGPLLAALLLASCAGTGPLLSTPTAPTRTIVMVWDGLRPDSVNAVDTPNLYALRQAGVDFSDNHATYPTFTMMNASSFATGSFPKTSGFYGNTFWTPPQGAANTIPSGNTGGGARQDYVAPVFTEDYQVLSTLNDYYGGQLLMVKSLFATAQSAGMVTAVVGKSGAAYIQDLGRGGYFLDENTVMPRSFAAELQSAGIALPANVVKGYSGADAVTLAAANGNPTARAGYVTFDTAAFDPQGQVKIAARDSSNTSQGAPEDAANKYMMAVFTQFILPRKKPMLSLVWFRTPDNVEHGYGPGSANMRAGLRSQDARLGELMQALRANGMDRTTNIVVVSDHGHSSVSGPLSLYPLRGIAAGAVGSVSVDGYSFSGDVRSADLLTYRGFHAYDGAGCLTSAMAGLAANGTPTVPVKLDASGALCGAPNTKYQAVSASLPSPVASFRVPAPGKLPVDGIVVAANGGSDYFYVPSHDAALVRRLVTFLQQREEYGPVFVDSRYGAIPGTLPMELLNLENRARKDNGQPDLIVSFSWDATASVQGMPGIEFESFGGQRGMHGSFGITDVHNTLIANGPSFRSATVLRTPTGNVDLAPTVAHVLGLAMNQADGRVVDEALASPTTTTSPTVTQTVLAPSAPASGLRFEVANDPTGATADASAAAGRYTIELVVKELHSGGRTWRYFDYARAVRQ